MCSHCRIPGLIYWSFCDLLDEALFHDDIIKWEHFPCNWPFVQGIHRSPVNSLHKGQWRQCHQCSLSDIDFTGPWFDIKTLFYQYRKYHCRDKMILWPSSLHNDISYTGKTTSLYWIGALGLNSCISDAVASRVVQILCWYRPRGVYILQLG